VNKSILKVNIFLNTPETSHGSKIPLLCSEKYSGIKIFFEYAGHIPAALPPSGVARAAIHLVMVIGIILVAPCDYPGKSLNITSVIFALPAATRIFF
jgi:hypothetical protein